MPDSNARSRAALKRQFCGPLACAVTSSDLVPPNNWETVRRLKLCCPESALSQDQNLSAFSLAGPSRLTRSGGQIFPPQIPPPAFPPVRGGGSGREPFSSPDLL